MPENVLNAFQGLNSFIVAPILILIMSSFYVANNNNAGFVVALINAIIILVLVAFEIGNKKANFCIPIIALLLCFLISFPLLTDKAYQDLENKYDIQLCNNQSLTLNSTGHMLSELTVTKEDDVVLFETKNTELP